MPDVPTLQTKRLRLRVWAARDLAPLTAFYGNDPDSIFVGGPLQCAETAVRFTAMLQQWHLRGYGAFVITEHGHDDFLGWCGARPHIDCAEPSLQWALIASARGKGYMAEAGRSIIDFLFQATGRQTLWTTIHPLNVASQATANRLGGIRTGGTAVDDGHDVDIWQFQRHRR